MTVHELAIRQLADYDRRTPGMAFADSDLVLTLDQAYAVQFEVARLRQQRGEQLAGYKIGCISQTMQRQLGLDRPVFGHVWENECHPSGSELSIARFANLAIEGELAVRVDADIPHGQWLRDHPETLATGLIVIELHHYLFRGTATQRAVELIANNAIHGGVILPDHESPIWPLAGWAFRVLRNGELLGESTGQELSGGLLPGVIQLADHLERYGQRLRRGQLILTGSPLPLWYVNPGDHIEVECAGLGQKVNAFVHL
jgi:2-keto-4-pentenoate hydratase